VEQIDVYLLHISFKSQQGPCLRGLVGDKRNMRGMRGMREMRGMTERERTGSTCVCCRTEGKG
jgi:hypothetical protein